MNNKRATMEGLRRLGYMVMRGRSTKYECFGMNGPWEFLVGRSGALRRIRAGAPIASSVSWSETFLHENIRKIGRGEIEPVELYPALGIGLSAEVGVGHTILDAIPADYAAESP